MALYWKYMKMVFRCHLQYRVSFILSMIAQMLVPFTVFAGMLLLFQRFHLLGSWSVNEVMLCFAAIHMSFALSECFARGFDAFSQVVSQGEFDRVMVRPRGTILQVLGARFEFTRIGRLILAIVVMAVALSRLSIAWSLLKAMSLVLMVACGTLVFAGIFMMAATLCFWTLQGLEVVNIFTDGGREMAQYPLDIYKKEITRFFTFVIPFGTVNYLPLQYLLDRPGSSSWHAFVPLLALLFLIPCGLLWRYGVSRYQSAGS
jgi:ABC-2 type transport system permease protein